MKKKKDSDFYYDDEKTPFMYQEHEGGTKSMKSKNTRDTDRDA